MRSTPITQRWTVRQTAEPTVGGPPWEWINPQGGANGNNKEIYTYNPDISAWELTQAVGPDLPNNAAAGALWRDTSNSQQKVYDGGWKTIGKKTGIIEEAETFGESDVTVTHTKTQVNNGSIELHEETGSTTSRGGDSAAYTDITDARGVYINPNSNLTAIEGVVSSMCDGRVSSVYLANSNGSVISSDSVNGSGDTFRVDASSLSAGTEYILCVDNGGSNYDAGNNNSASFPYTATDLDITGGVTSALSTPSSNSRAFTVNDLVAIKPATSGSALVKWPYPQDIFAWDSVLYQATTSNGTVDVFIEENQSGGWTEIAGPVSRGSDIPADTGNNVRFRIDMSKTSVSDTANLDAIYRRRVI